MQDFVAKNIKFILIRTTDSGNIGASARAIKNMGFNQLCLVAPKHFPHPKALARACGARDVLQEARVFGSLQEAIADCQLVLGTSSRTRFLSLPLLDVRQAAVEAKSALEKGNKIAILFGQERTGLTNEELSTCHYHLHIPCNQDFASLNLAAAVQLVAYELQMTLLAVQNQQAISLQVSAADMESFYQHLEKSLIELKFLDPKHPRQMMLKLKRLFNRAALEQNEVNILRGILSSMNKQLIK